MPDTNSQAPVRLALAGIGAVRLGIPVATVVQAIPVPAAGAILPLRRGALLGVVSHAGAAIPVVDLARWVETGERGTGQTNARLLILRDGGRTLGLRVDALEGVADIPQAAVARLHHDDHPDEVFHSAATVPGSGEILSLLDVARLAELSMCWHEAQPGAAGVVGACIAPAGDAAPARAYALLQFGALRLGVVATDLREVFAMPHLERFGEAITGSWCLWRGRHLPVLAPHALPGCPGGDDAPLLAVIEHDGLALGLPVQAVLALQTLAEGGERAAGAVTTTVYDHDGAELRLLDTPALFARYPEALLSRMDDDAGTPGALDAGRSNDSAYIVFEAGTQAARSLATSIDLVEHILPLPAQASSFAPDATMDWRGTALPLVDLRPVAPDADRAGGHVLVAPHGGRLAGYVVTRVDMLIPAGSARLYRMGAGERAVEFITAGAGGEQSSYRVVAPADLA